VRAHRTFREARVFTYVNFCAAPALIRAGDLWRYADFVRDLGVGFIQLLEPRPCGGYLNAPAEVLLTESDRAELLQFFLQLNTRKRFRQYPIVHYVAYAESPAQRGCMMGGLSHLYIDSGGNLNPCVFLPVKFGNVVDEEFESAYARMRQAIPRPLHAECPSLQLQGALRRSLGSDGAMPVPYTSVQNEWQEMFRAHVD
jgi:MoaA/NifB/PqqE/SkfB family radical SAM enzyme